MLFRLTVHRRPFCDWTGCIAHRRTADDAKVTDCTYRSRAAAELAADRLTRSGVGVVEVIEGDCPNA